MLITLQLLVLIAGFGSYAFYRLSPFIWVPAGIGLLSFVSLVGTLPGWFLFFVWMAFVVVASFSVLTPLRRRLFTSPLLKWFRKILPTMSRTEQIALAAGHVWWDAELFAGNPNWKSILDTPKPELTTEEKTFLDNQVNTLCSMLNDWEMLKTHELPENVWDYIKKEKFLGLVIDKKYGGLGFSALAHSTVITKIATRSISAAVSVMVPNSLGPGELISLYGTEEQQTHYLPRLASGEEIPCFALTSPEAGSDAASITDTGIVCKGNFQGKEVLGIKLNFNKRYITLAPIATLAAIAFKLIDPENLLGEEKEIGITLGILPTNLPGIDIGERHSPLNMAFMNGPIRGKDVFFPIDYILGGVDNRGKGWQVLMECLSIGRSISLPALSTAAGKLCYRMTGAYACLRRQFKMSVGDLEGVEEALARIAGYTYLLESARITTTSAVDAGIRPAVVSAIVKYHMTEINRRVINDAMDVHAGRGIQLGPRNYLGLGYQGVPIAITVEGANILTRNLIIFGQGAMRCHPFIRQEIEAAGETNLHQALVKFDHLLLQHLGYAVNNFVSVLLYGLTGGRFLRSPRAGFTAKYFRQLTRMSAALATSAEVAMLTLGSDLKRRERLSARLGDVLSYLYLGTATLKYYQDNGASAEDQASVAWCLQTCLYQIQLAFDGFFANLPSRVAGRLLRWAIFPFGRSYQPVSDKLSHQIAQQMQQPSAFRDRLSAYCYLGDSVDDQTGRMENAFDQYFEVKPLLDKLRLAVKSGQVPAGPLMDQIQAARERQVITETEADALLAFETARLDAIQVDDFPFDYFSGCVEEDTAPLQNLRKTV